MKRHSKAAVAYAEDRGYAYERQNAKGFRVYRHAGGHEVLISPNCDEAGCRRVMHDVDRAAGVEPDLSQKRNTERIKQRQLEQRRLLAEERRRHAQRLDELAREKSALLLNGHGAELTARQVKQIEQRIEQEEREHRDTVRQMTSGEVVA